MPEFDQYVDDYHHLLNESLAPFGGTSDYYSRQKVNFLKKYAEGTNVKSILDFGCGLGNTTTMLKNAFPYAKIMGTDISELSIENARKKFPDIQFECYHDRSFLEKYSGYFDIMYIANVFHHIPIKDRINEVVNIKSMLNPNGNIFFFEHNPYNPAVRRIVAKCIFDQNAILLKPHESRLLFKNAGFLPAETVYLIFFPHMLERLSSYEYFLRKIPIGAQYCIRSYLDRSNSNDSKNTTICRDNKMTKILHKHGTLPCPVCNSISKSWVPSTKVDLYRCPYCKHCFTDASSVKQEEVYGSDYYMKTHRNWFDNPNYPLFSLLEKEITSRKQRSVLDIGCGNGAFLHFLAEYNRTIELSGIDFSYVPSIDKRITFLRGDFLNYKFERKYDAIVALAVIEHLSDIQSFIKKIHSLLTNEGLAYIMTLNEDSILYKTGNILRRLNLPFVFNRLYDPHHLNHFSQNSLMQLLKNGNLFEIQKIIDHNTVLAAIDVPNQNLLIKTILKTGIGAIFLIGRITKKTYLQTFIVSRKL